MSERDQMKSRMIEDALDAIERQVHRTSGVRCRLQITVETQVGIREPARFTTYEYLPAADPKTSECDCNGLNVTR